MRAGRRERLEPRLRSLRDAEEADLRGVRHRTEQQRREPARSDVTPGRAGLEDERDDVAAVVAERRARAREATEREEAYERRPTRSRRPARRAHRRSPRASPKCAPTASPASRRAIDHARKERADVVAAAQEEHRAAEALERLPERDAARRRAAASAARSGADEVRETRSASAAEAAPDELEPHRARKSRAAGPSPPAST